MTQQTFRLIDKLNLNSFNLITPLPTKACTLIRSLSSFRPIFLSPVVVSSTKLLYCHRLTLLRSLHYQAGNLAASSERYVAERSLAPS
jgi:hypothetical protein